MTELTLRPLELAETEMWAAAIVEWHTALRASFGLPEDVTYLDRVARSRATDAPVYALMAGDQRVGTLALRMLRDNDGVSTVVDDLTIAPEFRRHGYGRQAMGHATEWARGRTDKLAVTVYAEDPAALALARDIPARAQHMVKLFSDKPALAAGIVVRPMHPEEYAAWRASSIEGYANDIAGSGLLSLEEARAAASAQTDQLLPDGLATPDMTVEVVEHDGGPAGFVWLRHRWPAEGVSFVYALDVDPALRGRGLGKAAMVTAEHTAIDHGSKAMMLNVFAQNEVAIGLYRALGYRVYAQYRNAPVA